MGPSEGASPAPHSREASGPAESLVWPGAEAGVCREECSFQRQACCPLTARLQGVWVVMLGESSSGPRSGTRPSRVWGPLEASRGSRLISDQRLPDPRLSGAPPPTPVVLSHLLLPPRESLPPVSRHTALLTSVQPRLSRSQLSRIPHSTSLHKILPDPSAGHLRAM